MEISKTFPYLSIAKKYSVDYEDVLRLAHAITFGGRIPLIRNAPSSLYIDVENAFLHFRGVQTGVIPFPTT